MNPKPVYVVTLTYLVPLDRVDAALAEHGAWLDRGYADGVFLASGRQEPRVGGVILAAGVDRDTLDAVLAQDPFAVGGLAEHHVTAFLPSRTAPGLEALLGP